MDVSQRGAVSKVSVALQLSILIQAFRKILRNKFGVAFVSNKTVMWAFQKGLWLDLYYYRESLRASVSDWVGSKDLINKKVMVILSKWFYKRGI